MEIVDCPTAFVEHYEGANVEVRQTNTAALDHDRMAYFERWNGIFWNPDGPELRGRMSIVYDDPYHTASRFPVDEPGAATEPAIAPSIPDRDMERLPTASTLQSSRYQNGSAPLRTPAGNGADEAAEQPQRGLRARLARFIQPKRPRVIG